MIRFKETVDIFTLNDEDNDRRITYSDYHHFQRKIALIDKILTPILEKQLIIMKSKHIELISSSNERECVVEFQAFRGNCNEFLIKELVILDLSSKVMYYFLFKPPYSFDILNSKSARTNTWLTTRFHYITWNEGFIRYNEVCNIIKQYTHDYDVIHTSGSEKARWLKEYTKALVVNYPFKKLNLPLTTLTCSGVKDYRHTSGNCAIHNALRLVNMLKPVNI